MRVLSLLFLQVCTLVLSDPIVSLVGIKVTQSNTSAAATYTPVLVRGKTFTTLALPGTSLDFQYLLAAFGGPLGQSYYVMDQKSRLYQIDKTSGTVGEITTYYGVYNPNCVAFDRSRGVVVVAANNGVAVLNPFNSTPIALWPYYTYNVTNCQVNSANQELWIISGEQPNSFNIVNYVTGKVRTITLKLPVVPLSIDFFSEGVLYLSNSGQQHQWGGVSVLTLANISTGQTISNYGYSFPEGGQVPTDHSANAVLGLDSSDPSHVLFASVLWDTENGFVCTAAVEYLNGHFSSEGGTFAAFGLRPGELDVLAIEASL